MLKVGFVGWRGMVGSVLMERMLADDDYAGLEPTFFSTSQAGQPGPDIGRDVPALADAKDLDALATMDVIVTCQGGDYTGLHFPEYAMHHLGFGLGPIWIKEAPGALPKKV